MGNVKVWVFAAFVAGALAGVAVPSLIAPSKASAEPKAELKSHWAQPRWPLELLR